MKDDPELQEPVNQNILGKDLFAHTSAVTVEVAGRKHFDEKVARELISEMKANRKTILERGKFTDEQERARVLDVYTDGIAAMQKRIAAYTR